MEFIFDLPQVLVDGPKDGMGLGDRITVIGSGVAV